MIESKLTLFDKQVEVLFGNAVVFSEHSLCLIPEVFDAVDMVVLYRSKISRVVLFWAAFILTRPLGATVGDYLDKPIEKGGLDVSRPLASAIIAVVMITCIVLVERRLKQSLTVTHT